MRVKDSLLSPEVKLSEPISEKTGGNKRENIPYALAAPRGCLAFLRLVMSMNRPRKERWFHDLEMRNVLSSCRVTKFILGL